MPTKKSASKKVSSSKKGKSKKASPLKKTKPEKKTYSISGEHLASSKVKTGYIRDQRLV